MQINREDYAPTQRFNDIFSQFISSHICTFGMTDVTPHWNCETSGLVTTVYRLFGAGARRLYRLRRLASLPCSVCGGRVDLCGSGPLASWTLEVEARGAWRASPEHVSRLYVGLIDSRVSSNTRTQEPGHAMEYRAPGEAVRGDPTLDPT